MDEPHEEKASKLQVILKILRSRTSMQTIILIVLFAVIFLLLGADRLMWHPPRPSYTKGHPFFNFSTDDGVKISGIYLPCQDESQLHPLTILYSHGNAEDLGQCQDVLYKFNEMGYAVFGYEYRGYGTSKGHPSEKGIYQDIEAAYRYLIEILGVSRYDIIVFGRSIGTGPSVHLAAQEEVGGLVMESGFTSAFRVLTGFQILPFDKFENIKKIDQVDEPVLVIHSQDDDVIPFSHGEKLFAKANEPKLKLWVEGARHNELIWQKDERYFESLHRLAGLVRDNAEAKSRKNL